MAVAGKSTALKVAGDPTALTSQPCTNLGDNKSYQIADATKRVLDPATAVVVEVDADGAGAGAYADAAASSYLLNPLNGTVTFLVAQPAAAVVRIKSGKYLPLRTLATARSFSANLTREVIEDTAFGSEARTFKPGLADLSGEIGALEHGLDDYDSVKALAQTFFGLIDAGTPFFLEAGFGGNKKLRAFVLLESLDPSAEADGLVEVSYGYQAVAQAVVGRTDSYAYAISD